MLGKHVLASRKFQRDYPTFVTKYRNLDQNFRDFLEFRASHRADEIFNAMDVRVPALENVRRCHLVHGKALLMYQLHGSEIRLIAIADHNALGGGISKPMREYARSLTPEDYYRFTLDEPDTTPVATLPAKPQSPPPPQEPIMEERREAEVPQAAATESPMWGDKVVNYVQGRQMLYVPRPAQPMIAIVLDKELLAEKGSVLLIDPHLPRVYHLTAAELDAHFQPSQPATDLGEALAVALAPPPAPEPAPTPVEQPRRDVGSQVGRVIVTIAELQRHSTPIDSALLRRHLPERDARSVSSVLTAAQGQGLVKRAGTKNGSGRGFYYRLTPAGERMVKRLDQPRASAA